METKFLAVANIFLVIVIVFVCITKFPQRNLPPPNLQEQALEEQMPMEDEPPIEQKPRITTAMPKKQLSYEAIQRQLDKWHTQAPDQTEIGQVGQTSEGTEIRYLRIGKKSGPKILIFAAIHGNEKLGAMVAMGCIGTMLKEYLVVPEVTNLLQTRDIYFIPVANPDGYISNVREAEGEDPNRCWLTADFNDRKSVSSVELLKSLHRNIHFNAVLSCHDYGRVYMYPWGCTSRPTDNEKEYLHLMREMSNHSHYKYERIYGNAMGRKHYGYESDWFYKFGSLALVVEIGDTFEARSDSIKEQFELNYPSFLVFIREAPLIRSGACTSFLDLDQWDSNYSPGRSDTNTP